MSFEVFQLMVNALKQATADLTQVAGGADKSVSWFDAAKQGEDVLALYSRTLGAVNVNSIESHIVAVKQDCVL